METINRKLSDIGLKPIKPCTVLFFYIPMKGCVSHTMLGSQMMAPEFFKDMNVMLVPKYFTFPGLCMTNSVFGAFLYLYSRPHLRKASKAKRSALALFGAGLFNLGSMLVFAIGRTYTPNCKYSRLLLGTLASIGTLYGGYTYISHIDSQIESEPVH